MQIFDNKQVNRQWRNNLFLFICILVLFIIGPFLGLVEKVPFLSAFFFTILVLSSVFVIDYLPIFRKILFSLSTLIIVIIWLEFFIPNQYLQIIAFLLLSFFLFATTVLLIVHVAASSDVNANIIFSAINGYLLIGIIGGISLLIIGEITQVPVLSNVEADTLADYIYFSFVTLTTLGYGDLTPIAAGGKVIAMLLATFGQLYVAILIAMLVGKFINRSNQ